MRGWGIYLAMLLWQLPAQAHREHEPQDEAVLPVVEVRSEGESAPALGLMDAASQGTVGANRIAGRPLARPADVLELVPGLIITQHSGQGKANQYFLRGFNLDHGTDFATTVNGVPVNMPTHAHGQGYSDLNFLIPELVERMDFRKGPYFVGQGDFASAGAANFHYRQQLDAPFVDLSVGNHGYARALSADSGVWASGLRWLAAFEAMGDDGPWSNPDRLQKRNLHMGLAGGSAREGWSASAVAYRARWNSTDQVPQRLLDSGSWRGRPFSRWDAVDPSDGGETQRVSLAAEWHRIGQGTHDRVSAWWLDYGLDLWSNFTYAMNNTTLGDQFAQRDQRQAMGLTTSRQWHHVGGSWGDGFSTLGLYLRQDNIRVGLYNTVARQITATVRDDHVRQSLLGLYAENQWQWTALAAQHRRAGGRSAGCAGAKLHPAGQLRRCADSAAVAEGGTGAGAVAQDRVPCQRRPGFPQQRRAGHDDAARPGQSGASHESCAGAGGHAGHGSRPAQSAHAKLSHLAGAVAAESGF